MNPNDKHGTHADEFDDELAPLGLEVREVTGGVAWSVAL
jgi:hypothetical protein